MNELLAKLTNLSYEIFGVILPGIVASVFMLLFWIAIGELAPLWTFGRIPEFTIVKLQHVFDSLSLASGIGVAVPLFAIWYFIGHLLLWIARSGRPDDEASKMSLRRIRLSLALQVPRPANSFDPKLQPLYDAVRKGFSSNGLELEWRQFYPVVKSYLSQRLAFSLVATYQNKYTFHRSITTASAVLFWSTLLAAVAAIVTLLFASAQPSWPLLIALLVGSIFLVWGFSGSYMYHWEMFGNTIITESFSLLHGPKQAASSDEKPSRD